MPTVVGELCSAPVSVFVNGSFDGFYYLDDNYGCQRKACRNDEFVEPEIGRKAEYFGDGINEDYDAGQKERKGSDLRLKLWKISARFMVRNAIVMPWRLSLRSCQTAQLPVSRK